MLADQQVKRYVRRSIASALGDLGELSVIPDLLRVLADKQEDPRVRQNIASALGKLGERSVVPELLRLLANQQVAQGVREIIAEAIAKLADSEQDARTLATLLPTSDIAESIYRALWTVSRRAGVRVFKADGGKQFEVVAW